MATENLSNYLEASVPNASKFSFAIVVSEWNSDVTENLLNGALETLKKHNVKEDSVNIYRVPGSVELVYACSQICKHKNFDALISIGSVIQGETKHFDFVCNLVTQGIAKLNVEQEIPIIFCLLTDNNKQQSLDRSGGSLGNKGVEAAITAIKMAEFKHQIDPLRSIQ